MRQPNHVAPSVFNARKFHSPLAMRRRVVAPSVIFFLAREVLWRVRAARLRFAFLFQLRATCTHSKLLYFYISIFCCCVFLLSPSCCDHGRVARKLRQESTLFGNDNCNNSRLDHRVQTCVPGSGGRKMLLGCLFRCVRLQEEAVRTRNNHIAPKRCSHPIHKLMDDYNNR